MTSGENLKNTISYKNINFRLTLGSGLEVSIINRPELETNEKIDNMKENVAEGNILGN